LIESFTGHMEMAAKNHGGCWRNSPQIVNLLTMAYPDAAEQLPDGMGLRHMCLRSQPYINEFVWARQQKKVEGTVARSEVFVLADYAEATGQDIGQEPTGNPVSPQSDGGDSDDDDEPEGMATRWLRSTFDAIKQEHHIADHQLDQIWRGKLLANTWQAIEDPELKQEVLAQIRQYWQEQGWWDTPPKGAARKARPIYGD